MRGADVCGTACYCEGSAAGEAVEGGGEACTGCGEWEWILEFYVEEFSYCGRDESSGC